MISSQKNTDDYVWGNVNLASQCWVNHKKEAKDEECRVTYGTGAQSSGRYKQGPGSKQNDGFHNNVQDPRRDDFGTVDQIDSYPSDHSDDSCSDESSIDNDMGDDGEVWCGGKKYNDPD